jgi:undecaprenyl-diphosphatase
MNIIVIFDNITKSLCNMLFLYLRGGTDHSMHSKSTISRTFVMSILCAIGFICLALWYGGQKVKSFDQSMISFVQGMESPALTNIMKFFTSIGTGLPIVIITIIILFVLYFVLGHRRELLLLLGVTVCSALLNVILKQLFHRERPTLHRLVEQTGLSFPSGHAMAAFSLYAILIYLLWRHTSTSFGRIILIAVGSLLIAAIGISRIYLGVHYPSDVIGGYLASGSLVFMSIGIYQRYIGRS